MEKNKEFEYYEKLMANAMSLQDTFNYSCKECGNCCRNRKEPVLLTGVDVFRIAKALQIEPAEVLKKHTKSYIGDYSKLPCVILRERDDGSCSLLRKGLCTVHRLKPIVCALHPVGRMYHLLEKRFIYFMQKVSCGSREQTHTLKEWLDFFGIRETEETQEIYSNILKVFSEKIYALKNKDKIEFFQKLFLQVLYIDYKIDEDYKPQLLKNIKLLQETVPGINFDM